MGGEASVVKKGYMPDPLGSAYCVIDYVHDDIGRIAARVMAANCMGREPAYAEALFASLEGQDQETPLLIYQITPAIEVPLGARFVVLHYSHHYPSRVAMAVYANRVKAEAPELAAVMHAALQDSEPGFAEYVKSRIPKKKPRANAKKRKRA